MQHTVYEVEMFMMYGDKMCDPSGDHFRAFRAQRHLLALHEDQERRERRGQGVHDARSAEVRVGGGCPCSDGF